MLYLILQKNASLDINFGGWAPIHFAAAVHDFKIIYNILRVEGTENEISRKTDDGSTPLHISVCNDNFQASLLLLQEGANPNIKDNLGNTPMHHCCTKNDLKLAEALIAAKGRVLIPNSLYITPVKTAEFYKQTAISEYLWTIQKGTISRPSLKSILKKYLQLPYAEEETEEEEEEPINYIQNKKSQNNNNAKKQTNIQNPKKNQKNPKSSKIINNNNNDDDDFENDDNEDNNNTSQKLHNKTQKHQEKSYQEQINLMLNQVMSSISVLNQRMVNVAKNYGLNFEEEEDSISESLNSQNISLSSVQKALTHVSNRMNILESQAD